MRAARSRRACVHVPRHVLPRSCTHDLFPHTHLAVYGDASTSYTYSRRKPTTRARSERELAVAFAPIRRARSSLAAASRRIEEPSDPIRACTKHPIHPSSGARPCRCRCGCSRARMHASCMGTVAGRRRASRVSSRRGRRWPARAAWPAGKKPRRLFCLRGSRKAGRRRAYGEACAWCRQRRCDGRGGKRDEGFCPESQVVRRRAARPRPWTIARFVPVSKRKEVEVQCTVVRTYHEG